MRVDAWDDGGPRAKGRRCDWPGCEWRAATLFRVPGQFAWFYACSPHARAWHAASFGERERLSRAANATTTAGPQPARRAWVNNR